MDSHPIKYESIKKVRIALTIVVLCSIAYADVQIEIAPVPSLPAIPEAQRIVSAIHDLAMRLPRDAWERDLLAASRRSFEPVLAPPIGPLVGMNRAKDDVGDVLVAGWQSGSLGNMGIAGFWIWDSPEDSWFVIQCDLARFASADSADKFLQQVLTWHFVIPLRIQFKYAAPSGPTFLVGNGGVPRVPRGGDYFVYGIRSGAEAYLLVRVGKSYFKRDYPDGGTFVSERFPPLKQLVATWNKEQILTEVDKTRLVSSPMAHNNARDEILIAAAAQRGLNQRDLERLLLSTDSPDPVALELRTSTVMRALVNSHQIDRNREGIEEIVRQFGGRQDHGFIGLEQVFRVLAESVESDYNNLALECLRTCASPESALKYLIKRGNSEDAYVKVKAAVLDRRSGALQSQALKEIRARIDQGRAAR